MQPITPITGSRRGGQATPPQVERIAQQGATQLGKMNADLMGATSGDRHLKPVALLASFQQGQFGMGGEPPSQVGPIARSLMERLWPPDPTQQGVRAFHNIGANRQRICEFQALHPLAPGLIELATPSLRPKMGGERSLGSGRRAHT